MPILLSNMHRVIRRRGIVCVLALALLFAQVALLLHKLDMDSHGPDAACEICITQAHGNGVLPTIVSLPSLPVIAVYESVTFQTAPITQPVWHKHTRAPPALA